MLSGITDNLWSWDYDLRMPGGIILPSRCTIVKLPDGALVLVSPADLDETGWAQIEALGPVRHLVAPNCFHHLYLRRAAERHPDAEVHVAPGLEKKRSDVRVTSVLGETPPPSWQGVLELMHIDGAPKMNEVVLLHRPTRTLIVTDLFFNMGEPRNLQSRLAFTIFGTNNRFVTSRLVKLVVKDKQAFQTSVRRILETEPERIVPAHGAVVTGPDVKARALAAAGV